MAAHGEIRWPPVGRFNGRLWGESHGRRHARAQTDYASAVSRVAMHGMPPVVAAWRAFQDNATTETLEGPALMVAASQATRAQLGHGSAADADLHVLLFGPGSPSRP